MGVSCRPTVQMVLEIQVSNEVDIYNGRQFVSEEFEEFMKAIDGNISPRAQDFRKVLIKNLSKKAKESRGIEYEALLDWGNTS